MEMAVAMIVLSLITVVLTPFIQMQIRSYFDARDSKYALQLMRIGMNRILYEIADARSTGDINTHSSTEFDFDNVDGDEIEIKYGTFTYNGTSTDCILFRVVTGGWFSSSQPLPLVPDVTTCTFTYFDQNGNVTGTASLIRLIRIEFTCTHNGKTFSISNQIAPPNFQT